MAIYFDENGVRLADAAVVAEPPAPVQPEEPAPTEQPEVNRTEHMRMMDAVREAAREYDTPTAGDIKEFIAGRAKDPSKVDVEKFLEMTLEQRQNDLIDLLDNHLRTQGPLKRGRRKLRVHAPRGYLRRLLRSMDAQGIAQVALRLRSLGHDEAHISEFLTKKFGEDTMTDVQNKMAQMADSDNWHTDDLFLENFDDFEDRSDVGFTVDPVQMAQKIVQNMPQPVINVTVQAPKTGKKIVKRDPVTGLVESIEEEDAC